MFQREFALRLTARPGSALWSRLSANVQLYAKVDHVLKVSRNNFRPPPQVESSVVRLVPLNPPPPVAFSEFDGLTRILFVRRNKHVRANFSAKGVLEMLEANYKTWLASQNNDSAMEVDDMGKIVDAILEETGYAEQRAAKMDVEDFLR
jgi:18S rRNA (adenine1779-N6/adenine1780-N6)-dimethyltransferase